MNGVEASWTELNPRNLFSSRGMASASNNAARKVVELQEHYSSRPGPDCLTHFYKRLFVTLRECGAQGRMKNCMEVACTVLCTVVVLVLAEIKCDNGGKLSSAMEVNKTNLMFSEVAKHCSNTSAKKLPEMRRQTRACLRLLSLPNSPQPALSRTLPTGSTPWW